MKSKTSMCVWVSTLAAIACGATRPDIAAFYFPDYHADPINERVHGQGWTEWDIVKAARPRFEGHQQPRVPVWGYEDESDPKVMAKKIDCAAKYGVDCFIFDWYWYDDMPFLERCLNEGFLKAPNRDKVKFCLMWANHDWSNMPIYLNGGTPKLMTVDMTDAAFDDACDHVIKDYFSQPNYYKVNGAPYFSFFEPNQLLRNFGGPFKLATGVKRRLDRFRAKTKAAGFPDLHLNCIVNTWMLLPGGNSSQGVPKGLKELGFDSATSYTIVHHAPLGPVAKNDYNEAVDHYIEYLDRAVGEFNVPYFPNASVGWDPSPRTMPTDRWTAQHGSPWGGILWDNTPKNFERYLRLIKERTDKMEKAPALITVNSWNEWTETSYLEPDTIYGYGYLEAIRNVFGAGE